MAPNGQDSSIDGLIRRNLRSAIASGPNCPGADVFAAYYERSLDAKETAGFETHLSGCERCREQLAMMVRTEEEPVPAARSLWVWDWRLLAPGVAALLVLTIWGVHRFAVTPTHTADQPLVAMSQPSQGASQGASQELRQQANPQATPPQLSPGNPPGSSQPGLIAPQSVDRVSPKAQSKSQTETPQISQQLQAPQVSDLPIASYRSMPQGKTADESNAAAELKKEARNEAAPPAAPPQAAPRPMSALASKAVGGLTAQNQSVAPTESSDKAKTADTARAKQAEPAPKAFGASVAGALTQLGGQRSGSTIIQTPNPKILWRIAGGNFAERTENGGATWQGGVADPDAQLTGGFAPTNKVCWLVGKSGMILVSKDAIHWKKIPPPVPADFVSVDAKSNSSAIVTTSEGQKFSTKNEGKKWVPVK